LDTVVKWFILVIVFVFDPLSICLVLAYNFLVKRGTVMEEPKKLTIFNELPIEESIEVEEQHPEPAPESSEPAPESNESIETTTPTSDPFPQYMTKAETESVLEHWWAKRNGLK